MADAGRTDNQLFVSRQGGPGLKSPFSRGAHQEALPSAAGPLCRCKALHKGTGLQEASNGMR